jgi:CheY-like chemotaxis protein
MDVPAAAARAVALTVRMESSCRIVGHAGRLVSRGSGDARPDPSTENAPAWHRLLPWGATITTRDGGAFMTRVLVVQRDPVVAEQMAASLRGAGYETELCGGPQREPCPVIADMPCPLVDRADVLVYDAWVAGNAFGGHELVTALREVYVDLPVVLTSVDQSVGWAERAGPHRVIPLGSRPRDTELIEAIEVALGDQGMAV